MQDRTESSREAGAAEMPRISVSGPGNGGPILQVGRRRGWAFLCVPQQPSMLPDCLF